MKKNQENYSYRKKRHSKKLRGGRKLNNKTKKNYSYRSKKLKGGAGKLNTKNPKNNKKKRPQMTAQNYTEQLYKSFPYSFVLHGEVGTKAVKKEEKLQREYYEAINELNTTKKNKRSSVTAIPKQEANSEGLMSAFAKGQQEGLVDHSRMMSAARRVTQPISRITGQSISESPRDILAQGRTLMGPSTGRKGTSMRSRRTGSTSRIKGKTTKGMPGPGMPGYVPGMTGPGMTGPGMPGYVPGMPVSDEPEFVETGSLLPGAVEGVDDENTQETPTEEEKEQCPCCDRVFENEVFSLQEIQEKVKTAINRKKNNAIKNKKKTKKNKSEKEKQKKIKNITKQIQKLLKDPKIKSFGVQDPDLKKELEELESIKAKLELVIKHKDLENWSENLKNSMVNNDIDELTFEVSILTKKAEVAQEAQIEAAKATANEKAKAEEDKAKAEEEQKAKDKAAWLAKCKNNDMGQVEAEALWNKRKKTEPQEN
jgi:hypothetical protein